MKPILQRLLLGGAAFALAAGASSAAVTLTEDTFSANGSSAPVYILENQWMKVIIQKGAVDWTPTLPNHGPVPYLDSPGQVLALYDKTGSVPDASQLSVLNAQGSRKETVDGTPNVDVEYPSFSNVRSFLAFRDRMDARDPNLTNPATVSGTVDAGKTVASVTVGEDAGTAGFHITKTYTLKDNVKWLQTDFAWQNNNSSPYARPDASASSAIESIIYATPGGAKDANDISYALVKENIATGSVAGINATVGNQWYGGGGTPLAPELAQGWLSTIDPANQSVLATTWDLAAQQAADNGVSKVRGGSFGSRFTFEILYQNIPANSTLNFTHNLIVDNGLKALSYAKEGQLLAAIETEDAYNLESTATATFKLNSLNPTAEVTYDIKNIHVEDRKTGTTVAGVTLADINGVKVGANAHVTAGTRQFTPRTPGFTEGESYVVKGDLYQGASLVSTLSSRPFQINAANAKVFLYQDSASGDYVLENEVYRAVIDDETGQVSFFFLKNPTTGELIRGQTVTSTPPYPMFRDYMQTMSAQVPFGTYVATLNPNGTDSATSRSLKFDAIANDGTALLSKTYSLDSLSRSLKVDFNVNTFTDIGGGGFYSEVPMAPGGTSGSSDQFSAHSANGLVLTHPDPSGLASAEYWFGAKNDAGNIVAADLPELDQPWMGMRDNGTGDALAVSWDLAKQKQYSATLDGKKVTMNSIFIRNDYNQLTRVHFTNIPNGDMLATDMFLMADTGFRIVSYAEGNRVLAGLWANAGSNPAGSAFAGTAALTNTSTAAKTFALKNIRIIKDTGESTPAGPDIEGIAVAPAAQATPAISFTIPGGQAEGSYTLAADLYDTETKVTTLLSTPFAITGGVPVASGDLNGDEKIDDKDVQIALKLAGGISTATSNDIMNGDMNGDGKITAEDAVAIARKWQAG